LKGSRSENGREEDLSEKDVRASDSDSTESLKIERWENGREEDLSEKEVRARQRHQLAELERL
jgi:hypothetical protein